MRRLTQKEIIQNIKSGKVFEAVSEDYSFTLKIDRYAPYVCAAVHDGHQFRKSLWENCLHTEYERWYEEDPCTKQMVQSHPIVIAGNDSRFEYDLNRSPDRAIYEDAWGKQLWKNPLSAAEKAISIEKHQTFYTVMHALVEKLESLHAKVLVFDMHSYNWKRWNREVPTWNLGTLKIDQDRFVEIAQSWSNKLGGLQLPHKIPSSSKINDTFKGEGYFLGYITENFKNTLVLATEVSKIYCDETSGILFPEVVAAIETQLQELIPLQSAEFQQE